MKRIAVLCSNPDHPVMPFLRDWSSRQAAIAEVTICHDLAQVRSGDFLFLISCTQLVPPSVRQRFDHALVIHSSDLPRGRGWSPQAWAVSEGANQLTVSLIEADDPFDTGLIWHKATVILDGSELFTEWHEKLYRCWMDLMDWALVNAAIVRPSAQEGEPTYLERRRPSDSQIDPDLTIAEQFDKLRTADPDRFPAFFDLRGHRYAIRLEKIEKDS